MKRRSILVALGAVASVGLAGGTYFAYNEYVRLRAVDEQFASMLAERNALAEKLTQLDGEHNAAKLSELSAKAAIFEASRLALSNGVALRLLEGAVKDGKGASAEDYLALGGMRLLLNGERDAEAVTAFEKALELSNWSSTKKLTCAAQIGMLAAGKQAKVPADCEEAATAAGPQR